MKNLKKHVVKSAPEADDWGPSGKYHEMSEHCSLFDIVRFDLKRQRQQQPHTPGLGSTWQSHRRSHVTQHLPR